MFSLVYNQEAMVYVLALCEARETAQVLFHSEFCRWLAFILKDLGGNQLKSHQTSRCAYPNVIDLHVVDLGFVSWVERGDQ